MVGIYAFYIDIFWLNLFLMNGTILLLANRFCGNTNIRQCIKCFVNSAIGSTACVVMLLGVRNYNLFWLCQVLGVMPMMVRLTFGKRPLKVFFRILFLCYGTTVLIGGVTMVLEQNWKAASHPLLCSIIAVIMVEMIIRSFRFHLRERRNLLDVKIVRGEKRCELKGLLDTGNRLCTPFGKEPVHIVDRKIIAQLDLLGTQAEGVTPYQSMGNREGYLYYYRVEQMIIDGKYTIPGALIAEAGEGLLKDRLYQGILNAEVQSIIM